MYFVKFILEFKNIQGVNSNSCAGEIQLPSRSVSSWGDNNVELLSIDKHCIILQNRDTAGEKIGHLLLKSV